MASNSFGALFKITTWGESHGKAVGVVIDGCPAGLVLSAEDICLALKKRAPGQSPYTSTRKEPDEAEILSGVYEGKTTGTPISILIPNKDVQSDPYESSKHLLRPGHANYTYLQKYGAFDYRGGGRASARETVCRVAAGAIATKLLRLQGIQITAYIKQIGSIRATINPAQLAGHEQLPFCPDAEAATQMCALLKQTQEEEDSLGGVVEFVISALPSGLGDPVYEKLEANLAKALLSIPASKGFEIGSGFAGALLKGSEHNDPFVSECGQVRTTSNHAGGTLGGISTGMPLIGSVAFKPTSGIRKSQATLTTAGEIATLTLREDSRHDPCLALRAVSVVEAMIALVIVDAFLLNRCAQL